MRPDQSKLGANVGFGYLTDDDDDDDTGGAGADEFDALISSYDATVDIDATTTVTLAITANSAQSNAVVVVTITEPALDVLSAPGSVLEGWSQSGWSHAGLSWINTLTKASVSAGTTSPSFSFACTESGTVQVTTTSVTPLSIAPHTDEANGSGQSVYIVVGGDAAFEAEGMADTPITFGDTFTWTVNVTTSGEAQTNASVTLLYEANGARGTPTNLDITGWSEAGWSLFGVPRVPAGTGSDYYWTNTLTRTSVSVGVQALTFSISTGGDVGGEGVSNPGSMLLWTYYGLDGSGRPQTDQYEGLGDAIRVDMT